ncbi:MAG: hypothetical protein ACJ75H_21205 [Thermoanaerobaculia bacterium]
MTKMTWKRWGVAAAAVSVAALGLAVYLPSSNAAINQTVRIVRCKGDKSHLLQFPNGPIILASTTGFLDAGVGTSFTTPDGRQGTNLSVEDVFSTGSAEGLGSVTFNLDKTRTAGRSSIVANQAGPSFPATQTMSFHFTVAVDGHTYRSMNAANVTNSQVSSFPPAPGTTYVLSNELRLEDVQKPGVVALTMPPGKAFEVL